MFCRRRTFRRRLLPAPAVLPPKAVACRDRYPTRKAPSGACAAGLPHRRRLPPARLTNAPHQTRRPVDQPGGRWSSACTPGTLYVPSWSLTRVAAPGGDPVFPSPTGDGTVDQRSAASDPFGIISCCYLFGAACHRDLSALRGVSLAGSGPGGRTIRGPGST
jgi:hypothetical protein